MRLFKFFVCLLLGLFSLNLAQAETPESIKKSADNTSVELFSDGKDEVIAKFNINDGWHIYYQNPGEIGKPTFVQSPSADVVNQSVPLISKAYEIMDEYIYKDSAYFQLKLKNDKSLALAFNFVECADVCKPEILEFNLKNPPHTSAEKWRKIKNEAQATFPLMITSYFEKSKKQISLNIPYRGEIKVIPEKRDVVSGEEFSVEQKGNKTQISWQNVSEQNKLQHALIMTPEQAYNVAINYDAFDWKYFLYIALLAFFGGIILNAMPCVFPILSLKIFGLVKNYDGRRHYKNAALYTSGVLVSFLGLAAILDVLKESGAAIGWGFQLQSPLFVGLMIILFFTLFLYMVEALPFPDLAGNYLHKMSGANMFLTGLFAVLIASPCTGPFMGAAIGYAFMQNNFEMYAVFTFLALGYALPFALAEIYPHFLQRLLPKPGAWMKKLKTILALPILLTCVWLASVLVAQIYSKDGINKNNLDWHPYNAEEIQQEISAGNKVFIDFTAEWCLTCMFNEKTRLNSRKFADFVKDNQVVLFKADLTESNEEYNEALSSYGRDGIPVYIYYQSNTYRILPIFFSIDDLTEEK